MWALLATVVQAVLVVPRVLLAREHPAAKPGSRQAAAVVLVVSLEDQQGGRVAPAPLALQAPGSQAREGLQGVRVELGSATAPSPMVGCTAEGTLGPLGLTPAAARRARRRCGSACTMMHRVPLAGRGSLGALIAASQSLTQ